MGHFYLQYEYPLAAAQLCLAMLGMGATMRPTDFVEIARAPRGLLLGLFVQVAGVPVIALAVGRLLGVVPGIAVGLILVAAVPGGAMSNVATYLARGNPALSIALTTVSTLGCLLTTPLVLEIFASTHLPRGFEMPVARIAFDIFFCLLAPLVVGMAIGNRLARIRMGFATWCIRGSLFVILLIVVGSVSAGRVDAVAYGPIGLLAIVLFAVASQQAALLASRLARLRERDRVAIGIEVTIRNTNLALLVKASILPALPGVADPIADGAFFVALLYGGVALLVALPPILLQRRRAAAGGG